MSVNAERFTGRVEEYERYRLRYPAWVVEVLRERCGLRADDLVADVGAGTGMLAELLLEAGNRVVAIEPNAEMRSVCSRLMERYAGLRVVDAAAEATGLRDASVDLVGVGRAFHWFDRERALKEFERVLKPGGWVVLVSNRRDRESSEINREYEAVLAEFGTDYSETRSEVRSVSGLRPYGKGESFHAEMPGEERLSLEEFLGQTQSLSVAPLKGDVRYEGMQRALRECFARWSVSGVLRLGTRCEVVGWRTGL
jgi:ubiquinone/menaquinone biosynthesis C-methylase UbiE